MNMTAGLAPTLGIIQELQGKLLQVRTLALVAAAVLVVVMAIKLFWSSGGALAKLVGFILVAGVFGWFLKNTVWVQNQVDKEIKNAPTGPTPTDVIGLGPRGGPAAGPHGVVVVAGLPARRGGDPGGV